MDINSISCWTLFLLWFFRGQSAGSDARLTADTGSAYAALAADTESGTDAQPDVSPRASKEFVNPRGIRFTTVSSHGLEGLSACCCL